MPLIQTQHGTREGPPAYPAVVTVDALFNSLPDGRFEATELARGPWSVDALHGGPSAALLARAAEAHIAADGLQPVRLSVELLRPVPVAPLTVHAEVIRPGRKVRIISAQLSHEGRLVASATMLAIRTSAVDVPETPSGGADDRPPPPSSGTAGANDAGWTAFHTHGVEHRMVAGSWTEPGAATDWIRLLVPVVADEVPSPLQRVAAAADFGNGISSLADFRSLMYVNPDLTVYLHRLPVGEWVCLDAVSRLEGNGIGFAESALYDEQGRIGRSAQSLLVERPA